MPGGRTATVDIALKLNLSEVIAQLNSIKAAAKNIGNDSSIGKNLENQIKSLTASAEKLQADLENVKLGKVSSAKFTSTINEINSSIYMLQARTAALESAMQSLISGMSAADGGKFSGMLDEMRASMAATITMATQTADALKGINDAVGNNANIKITDTKGLADSTKQLQDYISILNKANDMEFDMDEKLFNNKSAEDRIKQFKRFATELSEYQKKLSGMSETDPGYLNIIEKASTKAKAFSAIQNRIYESLGSDNKFGGIGIDAIDNFASQGMTAISKLESAAQKYLSNLNNEIQTIGGTAEKGEALSLNIPINLEQTTGDIVAKVTKAISAAQKIVSAHPLELEIQFTSGYGTKKNRGLIKQFQEKVNNMTDGASKAEFQSLIDDITKGFGNALNVKINTDELDQANEKVRTIISDIKTQLNEDALKDFSIELTKVTVADDVKAALQSDLTDIGKNLEIVIDNIKLGDNANISELQTALSNIGKTVSSNSTLSNILRQIHEANRDMDESGREYKEIINGDVINRKYGSLERKIFANSKTGWIGNPFYTGIRDAAPRYDKQLQLAHDAGADVGIHTHYTKYATMSYGSDGDLKSAFDQWTDHKIKTQIASAIEDSEIFDADGFFSKYGELIDFSSNSVWDALQKEFEVVSKHYGSQSASSQRYDFLKSRMSDSDYDKLVSGVLGRYPMPKNILDQFKKNGSIKSQIESILGENGDLTIRDAISQLFKNNLDGKYIDRLKKSKLNFSTVLKNSFDDILQGMGYSRDDVGQYLMQKGRASAIEKAWGKYAPKIGEDFENNFIRSVKTSDLDSALGMDGISQSASDASSSVKSLGSALEEITSLLGEIKTGSGAFDGLKDIIGDSSEIKSMASSLTSLLEVIEKVTGVSSSASLDKMFGGISDAVKQMDNLNLRTKEGKQALQDIVEQYDKYVKAGGTKDIAGLTDDKKMQGKLSSGYAKLLKDRQIDEGADLLARAAMLSVLADKAAKPDIDTTMKTEDLAKLPDLIDKISAALSGMEGGAKGFEALNKILNNLGGKNGNSKLQATVSALEQIQNALNAPMNESGFLDALTKFAEDGEKLKDLATVLKASAKDIKTAQKAAGEEAGVGAFDEADQQKDDKILENGIAKLKEYGQLLDVTLSREKDGMTGITGKLYELDKDGQKHIKEIKLLTATGDAFSREYIKQDTADLQKYLTRMQRISEFWEQRKKQGTDDTFLRADTDADTWRELVSFASQYTDQIGEIQKVTRQVRQDHMGNLLESFTFVGDKGHVTMGREKDVVATSQTYADPQQTAAAYDNLTKSVKQYVSALMSIASGEANLADLNAVQQMDELIQKLASDTQEANDRLETMSTVAQTAQNKFNDTLSGEFDKQFDEYTKKISKQLETAEQTRSNQRNAYTEEYNLQLAAVRSNLEQINALRAQHSNGKIWDTSELQKVASLMKKIGDLMPGLKDNTKILAKTGDVDNELLKLRKMFNDNSLSGNLRAEVAGLIDQLEQVRVSANEAENGLSQLTKVQLGEVKDKVKALNSEMYETGQAGKGFWKQFSGAITSQSANFLAQYFSLQDFIRYGREIIDTVTSVDSALIELQKVSNASNDRISQSFENSAVTAQEYGATISEIIHATADWARLGYSVDESEELARVTQLYRNVGDNISQEEASQSLISTLQGFQLKTSDAESIVDKFNEVANNFAIDTYGIGQALERSAASFNASGTDLSKSIALVTTANTVVQNPEAVGTMFKTLSARIRGSSTELAELGEEEDEFTKSTSKLQGLVKSLTGFDIMKDANTYKDIFDIIVGIGEEWKNLTDIEQASLGEALAGKRNANALYAVINNIDTLKEAYLTAENAAGSAAKEEEHYEQSVAYRIEQAKASLQELEYDFLSSDFLIGAIKAANEFLQVIDSIVERFGTLGSLAAGLGLMDLFKGFAGGNSLIANFFKFLTGSGQTGTLMGDIVKVFKDITKGNQLKNLAKDFRNEFISELTSKGMSKSLAESLANAESDSFMKKAAEKLGENTGESISESIVGRMQKTLPTVLPIAAAAGVAALTIGAVKAYDDNIKSHLSVAREASSNWETAQSSIEGYVSRLREIDSALKDPSTSDQQELALKQEIQGIQESISTEYGEQASNVQLVNASLESQINMLDMLEQRIASSTLKEYASDYATLVSEVTKGDDLSEGGFFENIGKALSGEAGKYVENASIIDESAGTTASRKKVNDYIRKLYESNDLSSMYLSKDAFDFDEGFLSASFQGSSLQIAKDVDFVIDKLYDLKSVYENTNTKEASDIVDVIDSAIVNLSQDTESATKTYRENKDALDSYMELEFVRRGGSSKIRDLKDSIDELNLAMLGGDSSEIENGITKYEESIEAIRSLVAGSSDVYFRENYNVEALLESLTSSFDEATIKAYDFKQALSDGTNRDNGYFKNITKGAKEAGDFLKENLLSEADARALFDMTDEQALDSFEKSMSGRAKTYQNILHGLAKEWGYVFGDTSSENQAILDNMFASLSDGEFILSSYNNSVTKTLQGMSSWKEEMMKDVTAIDSVNAALVNGLSSKGLSYSFDENGVATGDLVNITNAYKELDSFHPGELFIRTANGIKVNTKALRKLQSEQKAITKAKFLEKQKELTQELTDALLANDAAADHSLDMPYTDANIDSIRAAIEEVNNLAATYDSATSAYQQWINAQNGAEYGDMYDNIQANLFTRGDELLKNAEVGTNEFRAIAELVSGADLSTASIEEVVAAYQTADQVIADTTYTLRDFFKEGPEGTDNFAKALADLGFAERDGDRISFGEALNTKDIAEALGTSVDFVESMFGKLHDRGFEFDWFSEAQWSRLQDVNKELDTAREGIQNIEYKGEPLVESMGLPGSEDINNIEDVESAIKSVDKVLNNRRNNLTNQELEALRAYREALVKEYGIYDTASGAGGITVSGIRDAYKAVGVIEKTMAYAQDNSQVELTTVIENDAEVKQAIQDIADSDAEVKLKLGLDENDDYLSILQKIENGTWKPSQESLLNVFGDGDSEKIQVLKDLMDDTTTLEFTENGLTEIEDRIESLDGKTITLDVNDGSKSGGNKKVTPQKPNTSYTNKPKQALIDGNDLLNAEQASKELRGLSEATNQAAEASHGFKEKLIDNAESAKQHAEALNNDTKYVTKEVTGSGNKKDANPSYNPNPKVEITPKEVADATDYSQKSFGGPKVKANIAKINAGVTKAVENSQTAFKDSAPALEEAVTEVSESAQSILPNFSKGLTTKSRSETENVTTNTTINKVKTVTDAGSTVGTKVQDAVQHVKQQVDQADMDTSFEGTMHVTPEVDPIPQPEDQTRNIHNKVDPIPNPQDATQNVIRRVAVDVGTSVAPATQPVYRKLMNDVGTTVGAAFQNVFRRVIETKLNGTITESGGAFASGSVRSNYDSIVNNPKNQTKKKETALTGELGRELVVYGNQWWTVGDKGAEFATIPKGAVVFDAQQTEQLLNHGKTSGRGKAYLSGTAYLTARKDTGSVVSGGGGYLSSHWTGQSSSTPTYSNQAASNAASVAKSSASTAKSTGKSAKNSKEFKETLDEIEILLDRVDRQIEHIDKTAQAAYRSFSDRNTAFIDEINLIDEQIQHQLDGYQRYMKEANSVGLAEEWAKKVREGQIDIEKVTNEDLWNKIEDYRNWYISCHLTRQRVMTILLNCWDLLRATALQRSDEICAGVTG